MIELSASLLADERRGELGQTERQVLVSTRVVDAPAGAVAVRGVAEIDAAELKGAVVFRVGRNRRSREAAAPLRRGWRHHEDGQPDREDAGAGAVHLTA